MIDAHLHYYRPEWAELLWTSEARRSSAQWAKLSLRLNLLTDHAALLRSLDARLVERAILYPELSLPPGPYTVGGASTTLHIVRAMNDATANLVARHPDRLLGLAVAHPFGGQDDLAEVRRAIVALGLRGVAIGATYRGATLDNPAMRPFLTLVEALDVPLVIHPTVTDWNGPRDYGLDMVAGLPQDLLRAGMRLLLSNRLMEYPRLSVVLTHAGGGLLALLGWLDAQFAATGARPGVQAQRLYVDLATATIPEMTLALATLGPEHLLLGSDWPLSAADAARYDLAAPVAQLPLDGLQRELVLHGNARALFG
jgi:predicted TIM-barrel fold metal-dependent hydrolase